jgi:hypothetical protein
VSSLRVGSFPTLVAGSLPRSWLGPRTWLAWSFLTRQKLDVRYRRLVVLLGFLFG